MKTHRIEGKRIIIYDDGRVRISLNGEHFCLEGRDIEIMCNKSSRFHASSVEKRKGTDGVCLNPSLGWGHRPTP